MTMGCLFMVLLCLFAGARFEQARRQQEENMQTVTQIAVVNMDTGVVRNGKKLNYAAGLVQFTDTNFTYTSLEAARTGILDGSYAAYIIIPEGFSACAASIETEPENIRIQYALNEGLREDIYNGVISDIHDFEVTLNANISYMYISAILAEFHEGQDKTATVMKNDTDELELIMGIDTGNLLADLEITEAEYPENEMEYVDLSEQMRNNSDYLKKLDDYQTESLEKGQEEFEKVQEADTVLQESFDDIAAVLQGIEITEDEEGNPVYQEGLEKLEQQIEGYKELLWEEKKVVMQKAGWWEDVSGNGTLSGNDGIYAAMENAVSESAYEYNTQLQQSKTQIKESLANVYCDASGNMVGKEELQKAVDSLPAFTFDSSTAGREAVEEWQWSIIDAVQAMSVPDTGEWQTVFQEEIVDKVLEEAEEENEQLVEKRSIATEEMSNYELALSEFNPFEFMDMEQLYTYMDDLNENIYEMEEEVNEDTLEKEDYVMDLYSAVMDNETAWRDDLNTTYETTENNLDTLVSTMKTNRTNINQTNVDLMLEFSKQLPYTRLGKVEYTRMYDFVSHPLEIQDLSTESAKVLHQRDYEKALLGIAILLIVWLFTGGIYHLYRTMKEEKEQDK